MKTMSNGRSRSGNGFEGVGIMEVGVAVCGEGGEDMVWL